MKKVFQIKNILLIAAGLGLTACQTPTTTTTNTINGTNQATIGATNANGSATMTVNNNSNSIVAPGTTVEASEPQEYQATVALKLEAGGDGKKTTLPSITAQVARSGDNRRMEFTLPSGEKVIYLDLGGKQLIVSPPRREYAELNKEALGIDLRRLLTPAQIVSQVKGMKGVERVGEEKYNGRDAVKYQYGAVTATNTKAGNVDTKSVVYVDKETGLPLHSETSSASPTGSVNGINNLHIITEMTNLQPTADANLFAEPTDYKKVAPEQIRQQLDALFKVAGTFIGQMMQAQTTASPSPNGAPR